MAINGIFGLPRSGKSTYLAYLAKKYQKKDIKVYSNFYIDGCFELDFHDLGIHDYSDCVILIDEISLFADSRAWKDFDANLVYFFTHHGHYGCDIWYASQSYGDCDKKIRNLTENLYYVRAFPFISVVRRIDKSFAVADQIIENYKLSGVPKFLLRSRYYKFFDSFVRRELPQNNAVMWGNK